jgi:hypothetical protein
MFYLVLENSMFKTTNVKKIIKRDLRVCGLKTVCRG